jgi:hypothetical protein
MGFLVCGSIGLKLTIRKCIYPDASLQAEGVGVEVVVGRGDRVPASGDTVELFSGMDKEEQRITVLLR